MFTDFLHNLRRAGVRVAINEWMMFIEALARGHSRASLTGLYQLGRATLVKKETLFDRYDVAFAHTFGGTEGHFDLDDELMQWLDKPELPPRPPEELLAQLESYDLETLRRMLEERRREQDEEHHGGSHWIGTGGTSPFGWGGRHPSGIRIGGFGGGRSAVQVAADRRFANLRSDRTIDVRSMSVALRKLRKLVRDAGPEELDLDESIDQSAKAGGEIELVFRPPKKNRVKLLLLMDVGGSMDPHAEVSERLFSAAHQASHFKAFRHYTFHNCIYDRLYTDMLQMKGLPTERVLKEVDEKWTVVLVGDAWMSPYELTMVGGAIDYSHHNRMTGLQWLQRLRRKCPNSVWLNPEREMVWGAPSVSMVREVFPMFRLTPEGLGEAVDVLRGARG